MCMNQEPAGIVLYNSMNKSFTNNIPLPLPSWLFITVFFTETCFE
jgi:hypothetical protein